MESQIIADSKNGNISKVRQALVKNKTNNTKDFVDVLNKALIAAVEKEQYDIVEVLLDDKRADPNFDRGRALVVAVDNNNVDIVELLLDDERIDISVRDNYAIGKATAKGFSDIVELLQEYKIANDDESSISEYGAKSSYNSDVDSEDSEDSQEQSIEEFYSKSIDENLETFDDLFDTIECTDDNIMCKLLSMDTKKRSVGNESWYYIAEKIYNQTGNTECATGWVINDAYKIGDESENAKIYQTQCKGKDDNQYVAKIMHIDLENITTFKKEILLQNKIYTRFPSITIPIYQVFINTKERFIIMIMKFINGTTVRRHISEIIKTKRPSVETEIINIITHCKKLLKFLYYRNMILHGDAHLGNFMIEYSDDENAPMKIKLIDFGRSRELKILTDADRDKLRMQPQSLEFKQVLDNEENKDEYDVDITDVQPLSDDMDKETFKYFTQNRVEKINELSNQFLERYNPYEDINPPIEVVKYL
jgi:hypothetical protein